MSAYKKIKLEISLKKNNLVTESPSVKSVMFYILGLAILQLGLTGCKKFVEVDPPNVSLNGGNVYTTDATAIAAVTAIYTRSGDAAGVVLPNNIQAVSVTTALSADELTLISGMGGVYRGLYTNDLVATDPANIWDQYYTLIYLANSSIEGLSQSTTLSSFVKQQLLGESKFMRAFLYFYLVNLYGDIPLAVSTDYKLNSLMPRTSASQVWQQIIADLLDAKDLMNSKYVGADLISSSVSTERVRPNKWVATALLARAYLYIGDYLKAEAQATEIINNATLFSLSTLNNAFLKNPAIDKEAIWQIQTISSGWNTNDGRVFILPGTGPSTSYPVYLNKRLVNSFENNDNRRSNWISGIKVGTDSFFYAYKYKSATNNAPVTEYNIVFRLAEQYLIRAEAKAQQGNIVGAQSDLDSIRNRAGLPNTTAATKDNLLNSIFDERRHELFTEWGHRWLDLKRTNKADAVMGVETPLKGGTWQSTDKLYPVSTSELLINPNLEQTPGY